ncbi:MAG: sulfatase family protein [Actinomycetota bacterium]
MSQSKPPSSTRAATRRAFVVAGAAILLAIVLLALPSSGGGPPAPRSTRPNIVLILTDDQRFDTLGAMPNVRRLLGDHGITFPNAFVTTSYCCPSRASILTGLYSHHTGVLSDSPPDGGAPAFDDRSTIATWLSAAGYQTAFVGKYLNAYDELGPTYVPPGWDEWDAIVSEPIASRYYGYTLDENGRLVRYGSNDVDYSTAVLTRRALSFLGTTDAPFFLELAPIAPHRPAIPAPGDAGTFAGTTLTRSPSFDEANVSDKPWAPGRPPMPRRAIRFELGVRRSMLDALVEVDRSVAAVVDELRARGQLSNTVIAFTSDNGMLLGEHRIGGKLWPYEESIRVPLVVRSPWIDHAVTDRRLALNIDLAPTFAALAGVTPASPVDGRSFANALHGRADPTPWRTAFEIEYLGHEHPPGAPPDYRGVRTTRFVYVRYANGWCELYDLRSDPYELRNLAGEAGERRREAALSALLDRLASAAPHRPR